MSLRWSVYNTQHINITQLHQREIDESGAPVGSWSSDTITTRLTSHTVMSLTPGTKYEFYVQIQSYGKTARTDTTIDSTGETMLGYCL